MESPHVFQFAKAQEGNSMDRQLRALKSLERVTSEKAVVIFSSSTCCMCHVVKRLFSSLGVAAAIYELDQEIDGTEMEKALLRVTGNVQAVPSVFVGSRYVGGLDQLIAAHICGALVPQLKEAVVGRIGSSYIWYNQVDCCVSLNNLECYSAPKTRGQTCHDMEACRTAKQYICIQEYLQAQFQA